MEGGGPAKGWKRASKQQDMDVRVQDEGGNLKLDEVVLKIADFVKDGTNSKGGEGGEDQKRGRRDEATTGSSSSSEAAQRDASKNLREDMRKTQAGGVTAGNQHACGICFETEVKSIRLPCSHHYCSGCLFQYITSRVKCRKPDMPCPMKPIEGCQAAIPDERIMSIAGEETLTKIHRFQAENLLERNPNARWCVNPRCGTGFVCDPKIRKGVCPKCFTCLCTTCLSAYHQGECSSFPVNGVPAAYIQALPDVILRTCPSCRRTTELLAGCKNITCLCGHRYCWICLSPYPCPNACGQRDTQPQIELEATHISPGQKRILYLKRMACCALCIYLAPIWIVASCVKTCVLGSSREGLYWQCPMMAVVTAPFVTATTFLLAAILAPIGLLYLIYAAICALICLDSGIRYPLYSVVYRGEGDGEVQFMDPSLRITTTYHGPLPRDMVVGGRFGIAALWFILSAPPLLGISLCLLPLSPFALTPLLCFPTITTNRVLKALWVICSFLVSAVIGVLLGHVAGVSVLTALIVSVCVAVGGITIAVLTPTSDWSFLSPFWVGSLAPIAWSLGFPNPVNPGVNPFSGPVPFPGPYLVVFQRWNGHITL